jgi:apolipoprotein N-acyltransferase
MHPKLKWFLAATFSGLLMYVGWVPMPAWVTLLFGFVPLLWLEYDLAQQKPRTSRRWVFIMSYWCFLVWNVATTWWVGNTTEPFSGVLANTLNALLMTVPFMLFHLTRVKLGNRLGYISLPAYWIAFEFLHLRWDLSWPWLTLGNGLSMYPSVIQWYEYTGILGGSLWIWTLNILVWQLAMNFEEQISNTQRKRLLASIVALVAIPYSVSLLLYYQGRYDPTDHYRRERVVIVQPNIDPYNTKFDTSTLDAQMQTLFGLSAQLLDSATSYLVFPETAIPEGVYEDQFETDESITQVRQFLKAYPKAQLVTGISGYLRYPSEKQATPTARKLRDGSFYDAFNTAVQFGATGGFQTYHKSKLVPGAEQLPYPEVFKFVEKYALDFGGTTGTLGKQPYRTVFFNEARVGVAPVICYESIYGEYCNEYVQRGADMIFIITNDGWWGNSPGHVQHMYYGALRAIETRRPIARSANTGISCVVNTRGDIQQPQAYGEAAVIKSFFYLPDRPVITFYVCFGDYIGRIANFAALLFIGMLIARRFRRKQILHDAQPAEDHRTNA